MSRDNIAYDGHSVLIGSDASESGSEDRSLFSGISVNRKYRGGWNQTRPPFHSLTIFGDDEVLNELKGKDKVVSGAFGYDGVRSQPHIILAVNGNVIKLRLIGMNAFASFLYKGWGENLRHTFFAQAESAIFIQNLRDKPLFWDGQSDLAEEINSSFLAPDGTVVNPMPIGGPMVYAHSRMFVTDENNIVWVSDPLYARGLVNSERNLSNFTENTYPVSGGGLTAPGDYGPITGITVIPKNPEINGHGPVLVLAKKGLWSIDPTVAPRSEWVNRTDLTQIVLSGRGNASPHSVVTINNDVWFRSTDGTIASLRFDLSENNEWGNKALSREIQIYLNNDSPSLLQYCYGIKGNNRAIFTTGIRNGFKDSIGAARYSEGMVSVDFDPGSTVKSSHKYGWDGVWTGLNVVAAFNIEENFEDRAIFTSHDNDGNIRFYELLENSTSNDISDGIEKPIHSFYTVDRSFSQLNAKAVEYLKRIEQLEVRYDLAYGETYLEGYFRPELYPCWTKLLNKRKLSCLCPQDQINCGNIPKPSHGKQRGSDVPKDIFDGKTLSTLLESETFEILISITGRVRIKKAVVSAIVKTKSFESSNNICEEQCRYVFCCDQPDEFYNYKVIS